MAYTESLRALSQSAKANGIPVSIERPGNAERMILDVVFGRAVAGAIDDAGYPGGFEVPLPAEDLCLYSLAELDQRQSGYRTDARTGEASQGWDQERYVIADWAANPVSIGPDGTLAYSVHGREAWEYQAIAPDLSMFILVLARWIDYYRGERGGEILDADFEVPPEVSNEVRRSVTAGLSEAEADNFSDFLLGVV